MLHDVKGNTTIVLYDRVNNQVRLQLNHIRLNNGMINNFRLVHLLCGPETFK